MKTKIILLLMFLLLICTAVNGDEMYSFTDDFSSTATAFQSGTGVKIDDNWASKSTGTMDGNGTGVTTFGFDGNNLVINTFKQDSYPKINKTQISKIPGINWTADHYKLSTDFEIQTAVTKSHNVNMWGLKFMQHNDEKNYYLLFFGGQYSYQLTNGFVSWGLYKVTDGNITILKEQLQSEDANKKYIGTSGEAKLTLSYNDGEISFNVEYNGDSQFYSGSYTDENPFMLYGNDNGIQLVASSCGNNAYPIYFKSYSVYDKQGLVKDDLFKHSEAFETDATSMLSGTGVKINDNWSSKATGTMDGDGTGVTTFGFDGESLVVNTFKQDTYPKISSSQLSKMPGFNWTKEHGTLDESIKITATVTKSHDVNMWGIKFMQHNDENNYYLLFLGGKYSYQMTSGLVSWGLYKIKDGNVTILKEQLQSDNPVKPYIGTESSAQLTVICDRGNISFSVKYNGEDEYYSGSCVDSDPYLLSGNESGVQLVASSCGNNAYPIYFNDVSIESYSHYITDGEPDNVMYIEALNNVENDVIDLNISICIEKLVYSGSLTNGVVYVSNDGKDYSKLAYLSDFKNGVWVNTSTFQKFRYIMFSDADNLKVLESAGEYSVPVNSQPMAVYLRINGTDISNPVVESSDTFVAQTDGNMVTPMGLGTAIISSGDACCTINVFDDKVYYSSDNELNGSQNEMYSGNNFMIGSWRSKTSDEGSMGKNNDAMFGTVNQKLRIHGSSNADDYDYNIQYGLNDNSLYYPALVCDNAVHGDTTLDITFKKSHSSQVVGVRFLVNPDENNNFNGYTLWFPGMNSYGSTWMLYKEQDGVATCVAQGDTIVDNTAGKNGYIADAEAQLEIDIVDNKISFTLNYDNQYTISGEYVENSGLNDSGTVWLMAGGKAENPVNDKRYVDFYNIKFSRYNEFETEKSGVMYFDAAYGKAAQNGVIDLGDSYYISRFDFGSTDEGVFVSVSKDNERYYNVAKSDVYNAYFTDKYRYIKLSAGTCDIKVLADASRNTAKSCVGSSIQFYPYIDGAEYEPDSWECSNLSVYCADGAVKSDYAVKSAEIDALCGDKVVSATFGFYFPDYDVSVDGNKYSFNIPFLAGKNVTAVITWYSADGTMKKICDYELNVDENGKADITAYEIYGAGVYAKVYIMSSLQNTLPLSSVKVIY